VTLTVSLVVAQTPFEIAHSNRFDPMLNPVTSDAGLLGEVTVAPPAITFQLPAPTVAGLPVRIETLEHTITSVPALAVVGGSSLETFTVSLDTGQVPLIIIHSNRFVPTDRSVTPDVGDAGVVTVADPAITVHSPVPTVGVFPAKSVVVAQTDWSGPAFAAVGGTHVVSIAKLVTEAISAAWVPVDPGGSNAVSNGSSCIEPAPILAGKSIRTVTKKESANFIIGIPAAVVSFRCSVKRLTSL
jgi:hypothetical protein